MVKNVIEGGEFNVIRVVLVLLALSSLCEANLVRPVAVPARPVRGMTRPVSPVRGAVRPRGIPALDPLAAQATRAIRGPEPNEKVFNVMSYGADASGKEDSTQAFMQAWVATCQWNGKSRLLVPRGIFSLGETIFQGKCVGPDAKVMDIKGTLKALTDPSEFSSDSWILFQLIDGVIIIGSGVIDGQGPSAWKYNDCKINKDCDPLLISMKFDSVNNAFVSRLTSVNSKGFHISVTNSSNMRLYNLRITAPADSPNTDGIHISKSNNIKISKGVIQTGDDCIGIIHGSVGINIKKVFCGPGHGISIGSLGKYPTEMDVRGITVKNCTLTGTDNGVRIKTWPGSPPSAASKIIFSDIVMNNVKNPIVIDQEYNSRGKKQVVPSRVKISDVRFSNIRGTTVTPVAVSVVCSRQFPCQQISLHDINLQYIGPPAKGPGSSTCLNTQGLVYGGLQIPPACR